MKLRRLVSPFVLAFVICLLSSVDLHASEARTFSHLPVYEGIWFIGYNAPDFVPFLERKPSAEMFEALAADTQFTIVKRPTDGGIREDIPSKYRDRYDKWKTELRSTEFGRQEWDTYANNKNFVLTITVSGDKGKGAGTDKFLWDDEGDFVGATITLGPESTLAILQSDLLSGAQFPFVRRNFILDQRQDPGGDQAFSRNRPRRPGGKSEHEVPAAAEQADAGVYLDLSKERPRY